MANPPETQGTQSSDFSNLTSTKGGGRWPWVVGIIVVLLALGAVWLFWGQDSGQMAQKDTGAAPAEQKAAQTQESSEGAPAPPKAVEGKVVQVPETAAEQAQAQATQQGRKEPYGVERSLDAIVRSDEVIKVGDQEIPVSELERKLVVQQRGGVLDKPINPNEQRISVWGVHVVRPGENLWDIHLSLLRDYMKTRGVTLSRTADRPMASGASSPVGKILKFAEHMVGVYNLETGEMSPNLNVIEPGKKAVVYNLSEIFEQLSKIDPRDLSGVSYDGRVLFFPEKKPGSGQPGSG